MINRTLPLLLATSLLPLFSLTNSSCAATRDEFMIMAWNMINPAAPWLGYFDDPLQFETMKDCRFNTAGLLNPAVLDSCRQAKLKGWLLHPELHAIVDRYLFEKVVTTDKEIEAIVDKMVKDYDSHPAVLGYHVWDEPGAAAFPLVAKITTEIEKRSKKPWYVNLLPTYASAISQFQSESYDAYVTNFIKICKPAFLSYDHYALMEDGTTRAGYWENMNRFYSIAKEHNLPVIPIIQSVAHMIYRETNDADLNFQVYSHLAYGAKGIQYFTYFSPSFGNYRKAPIDHFGGKTPTWHVVQNINRRLEILAPAILGLKWVKSYHFGNSIPKEYGVTGSDATSLLQGVKNHDGTTPHVLVGELKDAAGVDYLMVVNKDLKNSIGLEMTYKTQPKLIQEFGRHTGKLSPWAGENAWMAPGEGVLMKVEF
jgi:hypothetical protein